MSLSFRLRLDPSLHNRPIADDWQHVWPDSAGVLVTCAPISD